MNMRHALHSYYSWSSILPSSLSFRVPSSLSASTSFWYSTVHSSLVRGSSAYISAWSSTLEVCDIDKRDSSICLYDFEARIHLKPLASIPQGPPDAFVLKAVCLTISPLISEKTDSGTSSSIGPKRSEPIVLNLSWLIVFNILFY